MYKKTEVAIQHLAVLTAVQLKILKEMTELTHAVSLKPEYKN